MGQDLCVQQPTAASLGDELDEASGIEIDELVWFALAVGAAVSLYERLVIELRASLEPACEDLLLGGGRIATGNYDLRRLRAMRRACVNIVGRMGRGVRDLGFGETSDTWTSTGAGRGRVSLARSPAPEVLRSMEALLVSTVSVALAEIGDKTQVATVVLAAKYEPVWVVVLGTTLGMRRPTCRWC